jgi:stage V sporulation protein R
MIDSIEKKKENISRELEEVAEDSHELAEELGLSPRDVKYWIVDNTEMNELISYGGFQKRYPHWRWGMQYDQQRKKNQFMGGKAFEIVNNDDPCHAFLQMSNDIADQKAVITHVEAHSDFFANNQWFADDPNSSEMLARNSEKIEAIMEDTDVERAEVEKWIDNILCLEDNIDQYSEFIWRDLSEDEKEDSSKENPLENLNLSDDVERAVVDDLNEAKSVESYLDTTEKDILKFLIDNGKQYDGETSREYEDWQLEILDILREEAYYFAPQKMTKVMNEGWAAIWESIMMTDEQIADEEDLIKYADHMSAVLNSPGFNPYSLGMALWQHIENTVNRREVVDKLLRIDGITPDNFRRSIDFQKVHDALDKRDSDDVVERNYSLTRIGNQGFIQEIPLEELRKSYRYVVDRDRYNSIEGALQDVDYGRGWERMREIREAYNDVMFIDEFLTQEFVDDQEFFTYEYRISDQEFEVASRDVEDVRKKLLLKFTNFGKPTIEVATDNFRNSGELLLLHKFNGVVINLESAQEVMKRLFEMWGRPVNLATVGMSVSDEEMDYAHSEGVEPEPEEVPVLFKYDGEKFTEEEPEEEIKEKLKADEVDYSTKPEEWVTEQ